MSVPVFSGWLTFSGRRNRLSFLWIFLIFLVIDIVSMVLLLGGSAGIVIWIILQIPSTFFFCVLAAQRIRDFGLTGLLVLLFIPLMILDRYVYGVPTLVAMIIVLVIPGTQGDNRYGPDPLSLGVPPDGPVSHESYSAAAPAQTTWSEPRMTEQARTFEHAAAADDRELGRSMAAELERLDGLRRSGALTAEEFERLKKRVLDARL